MFAYGLSLCVGMAGVFLWVQISSSSKDTELEPILKASFEHITSLKPYLQSQSHPEVLGVKASAFKVGWWGEAGATHQPQLCSQSLSVEEFPLQRIHKFACCTPLACGKSSTTLANPAAPLPLAPAGHPVLWVSQA